MRLKLIFVTGYTLCWISFFQAQTTVGLLQHDAGTLDNGYILFSPLSSKNTYLIDMCGRIVKTWSSNYLPGQSCYLLTDGTLLRSGKTNNNTFNVGGKGGIIQKIDWNNNVTWEYTISDSLECQHHDIKILPNGNVLAIVWEVKTDSEAISAGRYPDSINATVWSPKIIEIQPIGADSGIVVWQWHLWDHLIQDYDSTKANYGIVSTHPQLVNINYNANTTEKDWIHLNSIDYNPTLDQILISSHNFNEIWIIDHSTTTAQAASHTGGNSDRGGDIIYRWGNPATYNFGTFSNQKLFGQHNAHWIESGLPNQNDILIFNNGNGRTNGNYSTVTIINPPDSGYVYSTILPCLPLNPDWIYNENNATNFYAKNISGAQQLSNGNVLICNGPNGTFFEVNATGNILWQYVNPVKVGGIATQGSNPTQNSVFKCIFYPSDFSGFYTHTLTQIGTIENTNSISNSCILTMGILENNLESRIQIYPNPTKKHIIIRLKHNENKNLHYYLINNIGEIVAKNAFSCYTEIDLKKIQPGCYFIKITSEHETITKKIIILK